ncbi:unnamed protein product [Gordionus sp. m RMFG-2023]|uniref:co-chaperone protein daf-41-like n=1 Tax=Gordionus sp. m RMFG-2023 TaxID=3053472 RepID=UPI0030E2CD05
MPTPEDLKLKQLLHPALLWAQRSDVVYLTVCVEDCKNPEIDLNTNELKFKGIGGSEHKPYSFNIKFYEEIDPDKSKHTIRPRNIEFVLTKKEVGPFWPSLTKDKKQPFVRTDFQKWKDEDDSEYEMGESASPAGDFDLQSMMHKMGGLDGKQDLGDLDDDMPESEEDDEDDLPELGSGEHEEKIDDVKENKEIKT